MQTDNTAETFNPIDQIGQALAAAQGELENAEKNAVNPHLKNKYADLAEVLNTVRPTLSKHGIAITQLPAYREGMVTVTTMLIHSSGQTISSSLSIPVGKADAQGIGSATTYARRFSLSAICGISQEDDDGNGAGGDKKEEKKTVKLDEKTIDAITGTKNREELTAVWNSIPVGMRHSYLDLVKEQGLTFKETDNA